MDNKIREAHFNCLKAFSKKAGDFALAGGTALELYYLHHRFSADLDFFSPKYDAKEMTILISEFQKLFSGTIQLETDFISRGKARVRFYSVPIKGSQRSLKIDFVEDVIFQKPDVRLFDGVRVYSAENIYFQKIIAIVGQSPETDEIGREFTRGRTACRDVFDLYMLSKKIKPLHLFLREVPSEFQRRIIHWYRTFSREELKLSLLDMDIYDPDFNSKEMIVYLENEINQFMKEVIE